MLKPKDDFAKLLAEQWLKIKESTHPRQDVKQAFLESLVEITRPHLTPEDQDILEEKDQPTITGHGRMF